MVTPFIGIHNIIITFNLEAIIKGDIGIYHIGTRVTLHHASNGTKINDIESRFQGQINVNISLNQHVLVVSINPYAT